LAWELLIWASRAQRKCQEPTIVGPRESWSLCSNSSLRLYHMAGLLPALEHQAVRVRIQSDWVSEKLW
jgi:hypothetical protein